jgi:segregation and condensation protein A
MEAIQIQYKLESFEGPMDLLLHLVWQHRVSIHDVPIHALIEQYLDIMAKLHEASLEIEAEFLEMAARLVYIKSAALLPKLKDEGDPAEELRRELLDYRDCQLLAQTLGARANGFGFLARPPEEIEADYTYALRHKPGELFAAYLAAVGKGKRRLPPPVEAFSGILRHAIVSVFSRYEFWFGRLRAKKRASIQSLLEESASRSELVATFLAVLMLMKAGRVTAHGSGQGAVLELQTNEEEWRDLELEDDE